MQDHDAVLPGLVLRARDRRRHPRLVHRLQRAEHRVRRDHVQGGQRQEGHRAQARRASPKYSEVVLKRGFTTDKEVHDWFKEVVDAAKPTPYKTASIVHLRPRGRPRSPGSTSRAAGRRRCRSPTSAPAATTSMVEELTIQHEFLDWVDRSSERPPDRVHVHAAEGLRRRRRHPAPSRDDASGHGPRRDRAAPRPAHRRRRRPVPHDPGHRPGRSSSWARCARSPPNEVEGLFAADLAFLQDLYGIINFGDPADVEVLQRGRPARAEPAPAPSGRRRAGRRRAVADDGVDVGRVPLDVEPAPSRAREARSKRCRRRASGER